MYKTQRIQGQIKRTEMSNQQTYVDLMQESQKQRENAANSVHKKLSALQKNNYVNILSKKGKYLTLTGKENH